jgi:HEPN domain-containing protein
MGGNLGVTASRNRSPYAAPLRSTPIRELRRGRHSAVRHLFAAPSCEVALKLVLERAQASAPNTHKLRPLLELVRVALSTAGQSVLWPPFDTSVREFVQLVDEIDEGAATFRYPVDTKQQAWSRDHFVDLIEFEKAGVSFQGTVLMLLEKLAVLEPLPIDASTAVDVAAELRDLSRTCRRMNAVNDCVLSQMVANSERLGIKQQQGGTNPAMRAAMDVHQNAEVNRSRFDAASIWG